MAYILSGDSGTVIFQRTATVTGENAQMSSKVTSNPIEGGGQITDHAVQASMGAIPIRRWARGAPIQAMRDMIGR